VGMQIKSGAIPGLIAIVGSENSSVDAKEEAEEILEEISSLRPDPRCPLQLLAESFLKTNFHGFYHVSKFEVLTFH